MNKALKHILGGICAPTGFEAAGVATGIKSKSGAAKGKDVALVRSLTPAACAAVFTSNAVKSAHIPICQERVSLGRLQAVVINSGNANCLTGQRGTRDALDATDLAARLLGVTPEYVLIWSTGVIGRRLPLAKVKAGVKQAVTRLSPKGATDAAWAITTTDTHPKQAAVEILIGDKPVRIGGMAKGAGMISPSLATMLAFLASDADLPPATLQACLQRAVADSFNMITVDGDMSPSDTVLLMANGQSGVTPKGVGLKLFQQGLNLVASSLARMIVEDGEGANKLIAITVTGAPSRDKAARIARAVANSLLVKCALHAGDPNWGRILTAAGAAGVAFDIEKVDLHLGKVPVFRQGEPLAFSAARAHNELAGKQVEILIELSAGSGRATMLTCDLSEEYVSFNAEYHT
jgi:glutamate N-acetyltransferase / amino-acid N-acetyltransferase